MTNGPPLDAYNNLKALIDDEKHRKEVECAEFLKNVPHRLVREVIHRIIHQGTLRGHTGDADWLVVADVFDGTNQMVRVAYLWELKAPQCHIFKKDSSSSNRLTPSDDLIKAETQLLYYHHEQREGGILRNKYSVLPHKIMLGGIVIGCDRTLVAKTGNQDQKQIHYDFQLAKHVRDSFWYGCRLELLTWSAVLQEFMQEPQTSVRAATIPLDPLPSTATVDERPFSV
jgi:hypothetical protein